MLFHFYGAFHASSPVFQKPNHPLYPNIDWDLVAQGNFAIVDPVDPHGILYLSDKAYQMQVRVSLSTDTTLVVLARPFDKRVILESKDGNVASDPKDRVSPTSNTSSRSEEGTPNEDPFKPSKTPQSKNAWKRLLNWHIARFSNLKDKRGTDRRDPLVTLTAEKLLALIVLWAEDAYYRSGGQLTTPTHVREGFIKLGRSLVRLMRDNGVQFMILYMKNSLFYMNKYLAGTADNNGFSLNKIGIRMNPKGIPTIIPTTLRARLAQKDLRIIRVLETVLKSYTAFQGEYELDGLTSIRSPHPPIGGPDGINSDTLLEFREWCENTFWPEVVAGAAGPHWKQISEPSFRYPEGAPAFCPRSAGPQHGVSLLGSPVDALLWESCGKPGSARSLPRGNHLTKWLKHVEEERTLNLYESILQICKSEDPRGGPWAALRRDEGPLEANRGPYLGRLAVLEEPAGKLRTVAMVDYWTQRALKPMHDWMMGILSHLGTDCTFDQDAGLEGFIRWMKVSGNGTSWSIDLKSATDMIPIELYRAVFGGILPSATVDLWIDLLRDRGYSVPQPASFKGKLQWNEYHLTKEVADKRFVRYERGQPMGALTSWPSMAIVHHALVLYSAYKAGEDPTLFSGYRVLGDDLVIGQENVANAYISLTSELQVPTSLAKTLTGRVLIFASQVYLDDINISPMSLNEELSVASSGQRIEMALRAVKRGWTDWKDRSVVAFLRLMLSKSAFKRFLKARQEGVLGTEAQVALIQALVSRISYPWTVSPRRIPMLAALAGSVSALTGNQNLPRSLFGKGGPGTPELDRWLAIALLRAISLRFEREAASYDKAFTMLLGMFQGVATIGSFEGMQVTATRKAILNHEFNMAAGLAPAGSDSCNTPGVDALVVKDHRLWDMRYDRAIARIVQDHFVVTTMRSSEQVPKTAADFLARPSSKAKVKMADVEVPLYRISDWRWPRSDAETIQSTREAIAKAMLTLVHSEDPVITHPDFGGPWEIIDNILNMIKRIPRLPDFSLGLNALKPPEAAAERDLLRDFRKQLDWGMEALRLGALRFKLTVDFTTVDETEMDPLLTEWTANCAVKATIKT